MGPDLPAGRIEAALEDLSYPVIRSDAAVELADETVPVADDEVNIGELISETTADTYHDPQEIVAAIETAFSEDDPYSL